MTHKPLLQVQDLSLTIRATQILHDVSFSVFPGDYVALIGPNGSGKTSLLRTLLGLYTPSKGSFQLTKHIGYVPQKLDIDRSFPMSVLEFLRVYHPHFLLRGEEDEVVSALGIRPLLHKTLGGLSGGELQKVLIVNAVLKKPELLFLDEPTAGIDAIGEQYFYDFLNSYREKNHAGIVLVSHDIHMVYKHATKVLCMQGTIKCQGTPDEVSQCAMFREFFGSTVGHFHHHHTS